MTTGALPWQTRVTDERAEGPKVYKQWEVRDASGGPICTIYYVTSEGEEHAERIVGCVNAHDDLVKALHDIARFDPNERAGPAALTARDALLKAGVAK